MLRGTAALLVFLGHLRAFVFVNIGALNHPGVATKAFYALTGLGHEAVIVFFALSGYLVGGQALADMLRGRWRWDRYLLRRLTRLWIVLIPALLATLTLDHIGMGLGGTGYAGEYYSNYFSGPKLNDHSFVTLLGNAVFLQTIYVPIFGTNGPMWSLANEFWYYVVFPLAASVFLVPNNVVGRVSGACLLGLAVILLPLWLLMGGLIWVAGAIASWTVGRSSLMPIFKHVLCRLAVVLLVILALVYAKMRGSVEPDFVLGFAVALCLPVLAHLPSPASLYSRVGRGIAEMSYSLYLTHFPLLSLIFFTWFSPHRWLPGGVGASIYLGVAALALAWAALCWWCFERNTDRFFRALEKKFIVVRLFREPHDRREALP